MSYPEWFENNGHPQNAELGEENENEIYRLVGCICTHWSMVDEAITDIFSAIVATAYGGTVNFGSSIAILASQSVIEGRLKLLRGQVEIVYQLDPARRQSTEILLNKIEKVKKLRNNVVHGLVRIHKDLPVGNQFVLQPPLYRVFRPKPWDGDFENKEWMKFKPMDFQYNSQILNEILGCVKAVLEDINAWKSDSR